MPRRLVTDTPEHAGIIIDADPFQVRNVRQWVAHTAHVTTSLGMDVRMVASELVTNSLRHSKSGLPSGQITVEILHTDKTVVLRVTDDGPLHANTWPCLNEENPEGESGRGLVLVESLCAFWDWTCRDGRTCVSAHFRRRP